MGLANALGDFTALRRRLENSVPAEATSIDGHTFSYQAPIGSRLVPPGGFVTLVDGDRRALGQVLEQVLAVREGPSTGATLAEPGVGGGREGLALTANARIRLIEGSGRILAGDGAPFVDASIEPSSAAEVERFFTAAGGDAVALPIGSLALVQEPVTATLDASGFDRHTFLCGQSGSGKTYSLGVLLERLLLDTDLRIVVIDPNSDFVHLNTPRPGADPGLATRLEHLAPRIRVRRPSSEPVEGRLRLRLDELDQPAWGALSRLDPIADAEPYAALRKVIETREGFAAFARLQAAADDEAGGPARALLRRVRNLGADQWDIWARGQAGTILEELDEDDWRALVIDIGTLGDPQEKEVVAQAVLSKLWARRNQRRPTLVVIDEAHNVCPQLPGSALQALATDYAVRIAAEGRKFGIYLLVSTQRPQKVHENVVSQCDNLLLMRMNSVSDLAGLTELFSFVPPALLEEATGFGQGQALAAGKVVPIPTFVRFGARVSVEGGSDVPTDWAQTGRGQAD